MKLSDLVRRCHGSCPPNSHWLISPRGPLTCANCCRQEQLQSPRLQRYKLSHVSNIRHRLSPCSLSTLVQHQLSESQQIGVGANSAIQSQAHCRRTSLTTPLLVRFYHPGHLESTCQHEAGCVRSQCVDLVSTLASKGSIRPLTPC